MLDERALVAVFKANHLLEEEKLLKQWSLYLTTVLERALSDWDNLCRMLIDFYAVVHFHCLPFIFFFLTRTEY